MLHGSLPTLVVLMKLEIKILTGANKKIKLMQIFTVKNKYSISLSSKQMPCFISKLLWNDKEPESQEVTILP